MDRNEQEYNNNRYTNEKETERILKRRDREKYLEELSELESRLASANRGIFWTTLNLLIVNPAITAGTTYYFYSKVKQWFIQTLAGHQVAIVDFWSNLKWAAIIIAITFVLSSLTLLWYLWRVASLQSQIAEIKRKVYRLDRDLLK